MTSAPFRSPEHALSVAYAFAALRIEPRNATAAVIDSLVQRRARTPSPMDGMSQHDWHAQAVFVRNLAERVLSPHPLLWHVVLAEFSHDVPGALALQAVSDELGQGLDGRERVLADALIVHVLMGRPRLSLIADTFGVPRNTVTRHAKRWREDLGRLRMQALARLHDPMIEAGLVGRP